MAIFVIKGNRWSDMFPIGDVPNKIWTHYLNEYFYAKCTERGREKERERKMTCYMPKSAMNVAFRIICLKNARFSY